MKPKSYLIGAFVALLGLLFLGALLNPLVIIGAGERGIVLNWGAFQGQVDEPGLHWRTPFAQSVVKMDVRTDKLEIEASDAYSHDLQNVKIHSVVNYNPDPKQVGAIYQQYGTAYEAKVLQPALEAAVKQVIAQYTAEEILSKRGEVQGQIETTFRASIPDSFIVTKYSLVDEAFSDQFEAAIEAKQVAQQNAEKAENDLKKAQIDAEARVAQAKGEAEAIKIQAEAITQQGGQSYVDLQAIQKWNGQLPSQMIPGATLPFINLTK